MGNEQEKRIAAPEERQLSDQEQEAYESAYSEWDMTSERSIDNEAAEYFFRKGLDSRSTVLAEKARLAAEKIAAACYYNPEVDAVDSPTKAEMAAIIIAAFTAGPVDEK